MGRALPGPCVGFQASCSHIGDLIEVAGTSRLSLKGSRMARELGEVAHISLLNNMHSRVMHFGPQSHINR